MPTKTRWRTFAALPNPAERNRLMHLLLKKVTLYEDHLGLDIRTAGVEQILEELDYEDHD